MTGFYMKRNIGLNWVTFLIQKWQKSKSIMINIFVQSYHIADCEYFLPATNILRKQNILPKIELSQMFHKNKKMKLSLKDFFFFKIFHFVSCEFVEI